MNTKQNIAIATTNVFKTNDTIKQKENFNKCYEKYINFCEKRIVSAA